MMVSPVLHPDGTVTSENILGNEHWFEPVVWVLQIMPLFFVAGGITGLQSWRRLRATGGTAFDFMQGRLLRLIPSGCRPVGRHVHRPLGGPPGRG